MIFYLRADMSIGFESAGRMQPTCRIEHLFVLLGRLQREQRRTFPDFFGVGIRTSLQVSRFACLNLVLTIQTPCSNDRAKLKAAVESIST